MPKNKTFDCVKMKRKGSRRVYEQTRGMTTDEELAFWKERTSRLVKRIKSARRKRTVKVVPGGKTRSSLISPRRDHSCGR